MDKKQINISELLKPLIQPLPLPTLILSFDLNILTGNQLFVQRIKHNLKNSVSELLSTDTLDEIKKKFLLLRETNITQLIPSVQLFSQDEIILSDISINRIQIEDEEYFILVFSPLNEKTTDFSNIKISIIDDVGNYVNEELLEIFSHTSSMLPFTLVAKNRLQKILDERDEIIWLKDEEGRIFITNKKYDEATGIHFEDSAINSNELILYPYQLNLLNAACEHLRLTRKSIVIEGLKFNTEYLAGKNLILLPITDKYGKFYYSAAILSNQAILSIPGHSVFGRIFSDITVPILILSGNGVIQHANKEFIKLVKEKLENLVNQHVQLIFPNLLISNICSFIESELEEDQIPINETFNPVDISSAKYVLKIDKHYKSPGLKGNLVLYFYSIEKPDDLENLIKLRGRMFDILIQKNPEPIFIYDKENLKFLEVNEAALQLYGYSRDEFLQLDLTDLYSPEDIQTLLDSFTESELDKKFSKPFRHKKKDGSTILVEISRSEFKFNDKDAHFTIVRDVTDTIEKEKLYKALKTVFDSTSDPVIYTDAFGFIKSINTAVKEKLGYNEKDLIDTSFVSLVKDEERGIVNSTIFQSSIKESIRLSISIKTSDSKIIETEVIATPLLDINNEVESFTTVLKVPQTKETSAEPKEIIKEVIKEVIVEKPGRAEKKSEIPESAFLSGVFHELLTPLNVIFGFSQEIIDSLENPTPEQQEAAEIINQNRVKLLDTMNSVIEYSEIIQNRSPIRISQASITELIDKLDKQIQDLIATNDIQFGYGKISSSLTFETDKDKFERMISGLIKIIARINHEKKIYFSAFPIDRNSFMISLSDQYGSVSNYLANTLEKLFSLDKDPKDVGAPKLTTHLTKFFIQLLGGQFIKQLNYAGRTECGFVFPIKLSEQSSVEPTELISPELVTAEEEQENQFEEKPESSVQQEATQAQKEDADFEPVTPISEILTSKLPEDKKVDLEEAESADELTEISKQLDEDLQELAESSKSAQQVLTPEKEIIPPTIDLSKLNCLYIEDQVDSQILFKVQLKGLKDIKFAPSFEDALPLLDKFTFDFIVIDINLQGEYNGLDALKLIHKMPGYEKTPIIAVTAYVLPGDKEKFIAAGFDDFIAKPIFREKMIDSLQKIFLSKS